MARFLVTRTCYALAILDPFNLEQNMDFALGIFLLEWCKFTKSYNTLYRKDLWSLSKLFLKTTCKISDKMKCNCWVMDDFKTGSQNAAVYQGVQCLHNNKGNISFMFVGYSEQWWKWPPTTIKNKYVEPGKSVQWKWLLTRVSASQAPLRGTA